MANENDDALIQQMAALGVSPEMLGLLGRQMSQGESWMNTPTPEGRNVGHTYVAASPVEHLAAALRQGIGGQRYGAAVSGAKDQIAQNQQGIGAYGKAASSAIQQQIDALRKMSQPQGTGYAAPPVNPQDF